MVSALSASRELESPATAGLLRGARQRTHADEGLSVAAAGQRRQERVLADLARHKVAVRRTAIGFLHSFRGLVSAMLGKHTQQHMISGLQQPASSSVQAVDFVPNDRTTAQIIKSPSAAMNLLVLPVVRAYNCAAQHAQLRLQMTELTTPLVKSNTKPLKLEALRAAASVISGCDSTDASGHLRVA